MMDHILAWRAALPEAPRFVFDWAALSVALPIIVVGIGAIGSAKWGLPTPDAPFDDPITRLFAGGPLAISLTALSSLIYLSSAALTALVLQERMPRETSARRMVDRVIAVWFALGLTGIAAIVVAAVREVRLPTICHIAMWFAAFQALVPGLIRFRADARAAKKAAHVQSIDARDSPDG